MSAELSYCYPWSRIPYDLMPVVAREFLDHGINRFVFTEGQAKVCLNDPEYLEFLRKFVKKMGVEFVSMHGLCGDVDLDIPDPEMRKVMIAKHIAAMRLAREFGSKTYTIHVGAWPYCSQRIPVPKLMQLAKDAMEQLVPEAEKIGIIIAVENSFEPPNTPGCVLEIVRHFGECHPAVGVCYDTGHANMMAPADWKKPEDYPEYQKNNWKETGIITVPDAIEQLQPYIVTTHIHDNDGYCDLHGMPFDGTIDWSVLMPKLRACPRMLEYQTEVEMEDGVNWAGKLLAPVGGYSIKRLVETFRTLGFGSSTFSDEITHKN